MKICAVIHLFIILMSQTQKVVKYYLNMKIVYFHINQSVAIYYVFQITLTIGHAHQIPMNIAYL